MSDEMTWPEWLEHFQLSIREYDSPCVSCTECLEDLATSYLDGMGEVLDILYQHWKDKHA